MAERVLRDQPTRLQQAVVDALSDQDERSAATLAFDMGLSAATVRSRLDRLWRKGLVERTFRHGILVWYRRRV